MSESTAQQAAEGGAELGQIQEGQPADTERPARGVEGVAALLAAAAANEKDQEQPAEQKAAPGEPGKQGDQRPGESDQQILDRELADQPAAGGDTGASAGKVVESLQTLAEQAGISLEEIYKIEIPLQDGRGTMALGKLKDNVTEAARVDEMHEALDVSRTDFENEMIRARQELSQVLALLPELPPELLTKAKADHIAHQDKERTALLQVKPEWADPAKFASAQDEILEAVKDYGFGRADLNLILDHRLTKLLHDFAGLKQRVAKANARLKEVRQTGKKRATKRTKETNKAQDAQRLQQAKTGGTAAQVGGVAQILRDAQNG